MEKLSDISLVTKVVMLHDRKSFDLLVRKYQSPIRGFFLRQTTASFSTWLYRIAYNVWYDYTRSHKETQDIDTPAVSSKNAQGAHAGLKMDLLKALQILNENERTCITLQLMDGLSIDKIAEVTGMVQGTIKSHLSRGKQKLASYLKQNGYDR